MAEQTETDDAVVAGPDPDLPDPAERLIEGARGTPVEIGGKEWLFADYVPTLSPAWNAVYDGMATGRGVQPGELMTAAEHLLAENYALSPAERFALLLSADPASLVAPVLAAIRGEENEQYRSSRTWTQWQEFCLRLAGQDPDTFPAPKRRQFVNFLVAAGVAPPAWKWVGSAAAVARRMRREGQE